MFELTIGMVVAAVAVVVLLVWLGARSNKRYAAEHRAAMQEFETKVERPRARPALPPVARASRSFQPRPFRPSTAGEVASRDEDSVIWSPPVVDDSPVHASHDSHGHACAEAPSSGGDSSCSSFDSFNSFDGGGHHGH